MTISREAKKELLAEIDSLQEQLGFGDKVVETCASEEIIAGELGLDDDELGEACEASEADPSGIEEEITQDYLDEVADEVDKDDVGEEMGDTVDSKIARYKEASMRLDRVAEYLESNGKLAIARRIDALADAIDAEIA